MKKNEITEVLNMEFYHFLAVYGNRKWYSLSDSQITRWRQNILSCPCFEGVPHDATVRDYLVFTSRDWLQVHQFGKKSLSMLLDFLEPFGLFLGMTKAEIASVEGNTEPATFQDESTEAPPLSFQDYINHLKQFADKADACAITNELYTEDGYKITIRVQKIKS